MNSTCTTYAPFISFNEGVTQKPYVDTGNTQTICFGETTFTKNFYSVEECRIFLCSRIHEICNRLKTVLKKPVSKQQMVALVDLIYNIGFKNFEHSTLLKELNKGNPNAYLHFRDWVYVKGRVSKGLVARREREIAKWLE